MKIAIVCSSFSLLSGSPVCPPSPVRAFRGAEGTVQGAKGSLRVSRRPLPTPTPCEFCCKAPWHPCMGWVLGSSDCSYNWLAARGRLFKSACSTRARSLFGNFCRGVKRASKELQSCVGFFPFLFLFVIPVLGLHPSPGFTQNLRVPKRWWLSGRPEVLGSGCGEVWVFAVFFFFLSLDFNIFPIFLAAADASYLFCGSGAAGSGGLERSGGAF